MSLCIDRDTDPYQAVEQDKWKPQQTIQQQNRLTISLVFSAKLPLHLTLITVATGVLSSRRGTGWVSASDSVWTPAFFVGQGFERAWALRYITLAGAVCGFLVVLAAFGLR